MRNCELILIIALTILLGCDSHKNSDIIAGKKSRVVNSAARISLDENMAGFVRLANEAGWLKILIKKRDFSYGSIEIYYSKTKDFGNIKVPIYKNEDIDFGYIMIKVDEGDLYVSETKEEMEKYWPEFEELHSLDVLITSFGGSITANYLEIIGGDGARFYWSYDRLAISPEE